MLSNLFWKISVFGVSPSNKISDHKPSEVFRKMTLLIKPVSVTGKRMHVVCLRLSVIFFLILFGPCINIPIDVHIFSGQATAFVNDVVRNYTK